MRTIRAFFAEISQEITNITIKDDYYNYFKNVLRLKKTDEVTLFNNNDGYEYNSKIINITNKSLELEVISENLIENENPYRINLYQSLIKIENFELVIQKATELGVNNIYPIITDYTNLRFDKKNLDKKLDRWQKIAIAAAEQSRRVFVPKVHTPVELDKVNNCDLGLNITLCPYTKNDANLNEQIKAYDHFNIYIGPEGGFSDSEMKEFKNQKFTSINLGKRILKAETAPINILSIINFLK